MSRNKRFASTAAIRSIVAVVGLGVCTPNSGNTGSSVFAQPPGAELVQPEAIVGAERLSDAFRAAAGILRPSVVTIATRMERIVRGQRGEETGVGSGVIVSADGFILTNNHVTVNADELRVELSDGRTFSAKVVGADDKSDIAVLKIDATGLIAARLGDSSRMRVGDWVIAVGSPFGLDQTVTAGIISAMSRSIGILGSRENPGYEDFLQTDAAINPGNSGGPLVNLRGEVIGINTAINSRTGSNTGIGFAISSNMASRIMEDLRTNGRVIRGFIGARVGDVTRQSASEWNLPPGVVRGAHIAGVQKGGPAANASVQADDVITMVDGRRVISSSQFRNMVALTRPNTKMRFEGYRDGQLHEWSVTIGELTEQKLNQLIVRAEIPELGIVVETLTPDIARQLDLEGAVSGALVTGMDRRGIAWQRLDIRPEDVIVEANGKEIASAGDLKQALRGTGRTLRLGVRRGNELSEVSISTVAE